MVYLETLKKKYQHQNNMETETTDQNVQNTVNTLRQALDNASAQLNQAKQLLDNLGIHANMEPALKLQQQSVAQQDYEGNSQVVEGIFNGQNMVGPDGKIYTVPANYASKSKLVEGDLLKLTIRPDGSFMYKQVGPVERKRVVGSLVYDLETGDYTVVVQERAYKVIKASITYYKGEPGDEVVLLVPEAGDSLWGAVENVISAGATTPSHTDYYESSDVTSDAPSDTTTVETTEDPTLLASGSDAELPSGSEAQLPLGDAAELKAPANPIDLTDLV